MWVRFVVVDPRPPIWWYNVYKNNLESSDSSQFGTLVGGEVNATGQNANYFSGHFGVTAIVICGALAFNFYNGLVNQATPEPEAGVESSTGSQPPARQRSARHG